MQSAALESGDIPSQWYASQQCYILLRPSLWFVAAGRVKVPAASLCVDNIPLLWYAGHTRRILGGLTAAAGSDKAAASGLQAPLCHRRRCCLGMKHFNLLQIFIYGVLIETCRVYPQLASCCSAGVIILLSIAWRAWAVWHADLGLPIAAFGSHVDESENANFRLYQVCARVFAPECPEAAAVRRCTWAAAAWTCCLLIQCWLHNQRLGGPVPGLCLGSSHAMTAVI